MIVSREEQKDLLNVLNIRVSQRHRRFHRLNNWPMLYSAVTKELIENTKLCYVVVWLSEAETKSVRQRYMATRTGKYLDTIILLAQYAFLCSGLFALFFATTRAPSYFWSEGTWPGSIADY